MNEQRIEQLEQAVAELQQNVADLFGAVMYRSGYQERVEPEREMFPVICDKCGEQCTVPFQPEEGRRVYCKDCFRRKTSSGTARS